MTDETTSAPSGDMHLIAETEGLRFAVNLLSDRKVRAARTLIAVGDLADAQIYFDARLPRLAEGEWLELIDCGAEGTLIRSSEVVETVDGE